jgi:hypothetical protein
VFTTAQREYRSLLLCEKKAGGVLPPAHAVLVKGTVYGAAVKSTPDALGPTVTVGEPAGVKV